MKLAMLGFFDSTIAVKTPLLPWHFASTFSSLFGSMKTGPTQLAYSRCTQFEAMVSVAVWLCKKCYQGQTAPDSLAQIADGADSSPLIACKHLLVAAGAAGLDTASTADISPSSLLPGSGEKVCLFLNRLADRALENSGHSWRPCIYPPSKGIDETAAPLEESGSEGEPDEVPEEEEEADDGLGLEEGWSVDNTSKAATSFVVPSVDPMEWRQETERVGPLLSTAAKRAGKGDSELIRGRLDSLHVFLRLDGSTTTNSDRNELCVSELIVEMCRMQKEV